MAEVLGLAEVDGGAEESFPPCGRRRSLAAHSRGPLVFDDIHWGEPTFLDLVEHLADWSRDVPILLLCLARPDYSRSAPPGAVGSSTRRRSCSSRCPRTSAAR